MDLALKLNRRVDIASLAVFRIFFGGAMVVAVGRFFVHGWIREYALVPKHFFTYWGFDWVRPWPGVGMYVHYALMGAAAFSLALGFHARLSALVFGALFTYAHFIDKTNYLNHYYFVSCLSLLFAVLPSDRALSLRCWLRPGEAWSEIPAWCLYLLRFQVGCVYLGGGIAKLGKDWLCYAQPLTIWLGARTELPLLGPWFRYKSVAFAFSWAGALFDLSIVGWLLWRKSRPYAYVVVLVFHFLTAQLFQIGMFPWIMSGAATIFFDPSWPRAWLRRVRLRSPEGICTATSLPRWGAALLGTYVAWQAFMPLRHWAYPGNHLWSEQGFRYGWNVMLMEKNGAVEMTVRDRATGRVSSIDAADYLTRYQTKMMSTQPDMILQFAHIVAADYRKRGVEVEVFVDARVSLNGRRPQPLVDPTVDLAQQQDGLGPKRWILPMNDAPPEL